MTVMTESVGTSAAAKKEAPAITPEGVDAECRWAGRLGRARASARRLWVLAALRRRSPRTLAERAAERGITALALTDRDTVAGSVRFAKACAAAGVRPLFGADLAHTPYAAPPRGAGRPLQVTSRAGSGRHCPSRYRPMSAARSFALRRK
jgi:hypothetical protein